MNRFRHIAFVLIFTAIAATGGFMAYRLFGLPERGSDYHSADTPRRLPELTLPDLDGKPRALSEWKGRPLLINFWATWCEPCRREIPLLKKLRAEHAAEGLEVLGIAIDFRDAVATYAREIGIDYPILVAEQDGLAAQAFGVGMGLPTTVFTDRDGRVTATKVGELQPRQAEQLLQAILKAR